MCHLIFVALWGGIFSACNFYLIKMFFLVFAEYDMYEEYVPTVVFDDSNQQESQQWEMISSESYVPLPTSYKSKEPSSERPFQCPNCNRTYKLLDSLKRHLRVECGGKQKQFQCYFCKKDFRYRYEMSKHITSSHWVGAILIFNFYISFRIKNIYLNKIYYSFKVG